MPYRLYDIVHGIDCISPRKIFTYVFFAVSHKDIFSVIFELAAIDNSSADAIDIHLTAWT